MEIDARSFIRLGQLINLLFVIGLIALGFKIFADPSQPAGLALADSPPATAAVAPAGETTPPAQSAVVAIEATAAVTPTLPSPTAIAATEALTNTDTVTTTDEMTATESVSATDDVTTTESVTATDDTAVAAPPEASASVVAAVAKGTCNACHVIPGVPGAVGIVGPNLSNIGAAAAERIPGYSAAEYIHESIVDPNAFIAPQCPFGACVPGSMPATLVQTLSEEEIATMVDYLVTLQGGE